MRDADDLISLLHQLDGQSYGAYKRLLDDTYDYGDFTLDFTRVQSDPYAPPSSVRVRVPFDVLGLPEGLVTTDAERLAAADYFARRFARVIRTGGQSPLRIPWIGQEILHRTSAQLTEKGLELRFSVQMPARGRRIMGHAAARIMDYDLPDAVFAACDLAEAGEDAIAACVAQVHAYVDYLAIRAALAENHWVGFVADDAILARASGISDAPMRDAVPFASPESLRVTLDLPHAGQVSGMAIPEGVTVIVGGGYHGKSTLLAALERSVYAHIPGDGRERCATDPDAVKVRAEDGRAISGVDISLFINDLPGGADTTRFSTENASGSTSQAAAIAEALEAGSRTLLIDEDTSATNLMIRDDKMRALVAAEPITPLVDRVRELAAAGVSTVLVMGGSGDYLSHADLVLALDTYRVSNVTRRAHEIAGAAPEPAEPTPENPAPTPHTLVRARHAAPSPTGTQGKRPRTKASGTDRITLDRTDIDISALAQVTDPGQAETIAWALRQLADGGLEEDHTLAQCVARTMDTCAASLDDIAFARYPSSLVTPRMVDVFAALSRYRKLRVAD